MGYQRHDVVCLVGDSFDGAKAAKSLMDDVRERIRAQLGAWEAGLVIGPVMAPNNGYWSVVVLPDGSKEGWEESTRWDRERREIIDLLEAYCDGIAVQFGGDDRQTIIVEMLVKEEHENGI